MGFSIYRHIPPHPPLQPLGGRRLETAVPGLLHLQWKGTGRFLKTEASRLRLSPLFQDTNSWNVLPCIECVWVIHVNRVFQFSVWFYWRKSQFWQGIFSYFKCEVLEETWLVADNYQITMWYLFFSKVMWSHRHCGDWRGCFRCKTFRTHQPVALPLFQGENLPTFLWTVCSRSREVTVPAWELGQCQA